MLCPMSTGCASARVSPRDRAGVTGTECEHEWGGPDGSELLGPEMEKQANPTGTQSETQESECSIFRVNGDTVQKLLWTNTFIVTLVVLRMQ